MGAPIRVCELLNTLERPYYIERVAIDGPRGVMKTRRAFLKAFEAQVQGMGYSFVEVLSACPTYFRLSPAESLRFVSEKMAPNFPVRVFRSEGQVVP